MQKHGVIVAGDALMDQQYFVEKLPERGGDTRILDHHLSTGGAAANTAVHLGRMGISTHFLGCVGEDDLGERLARQLQSAGVNTALVQYGGESGYTVDIIDRTGERTMLSFRGASARALLMNHAIKKQLGSSAIFLVSGYLLTDEKQAAFVEQAAKLVKEAQGLVALDPCPVVGAVPKETLLAVLEYTDILLPNQAELARLKRIAPSTVEQMACIGLKMGKEGATLTIKEGFLPPFGQECQADRLIVAAVEPIAAEDTTGAGDAFNAGLIAGMMSAEAPDVWLARANQKAGECIRIRGAVK